jgi:2-amino-4-hydroxy-6-hydroxymethyldihydropteridine diphosphokinase
MTNNPPSILYLALGSNLGDRFTALQAAIAALPPAVHVLARSRVFETPPWGYTRQSPFLNMVLKGQTSLTPLDLLKTLKKLETSLGRVASRRWGPRRIDIDILFYDRLILKTPALTIPHPRLQERSFVLVPLADLAPGLLHPALKKTVKQLLAGVDITGVKPYEPGS